MKTASTTFLPVLATMLLSVCITLSARADRAENAFVKVRAVGAGVTRVDGRNFSAQGDTEVEIEAQPGWTLLTPSRVRVTKGQSPRYRVKSISNEDDGQGDVWRTVVEVVTNHLTDPVVVASVSAGGPYVYALPDDGADAAVTFAASATTLGTHEIETRTTTYHNGAVVDESVEKSEPFTVEIDRWSWKWTFDDSGTTNLQTFTTPVQHLTNGNHGATGSVESRASHCAACSGTATASTNVIVSLLKLSCNPWIGQDRTGDPSASYTSPKVTATASLDPANPAVRKVKWGGDSKCERGITNDWSLTLWTEDRDKASDTYLGEKVTASVAGATATTNFTIVKVDVELAQMPEDLEEKEGAVMVRLDSNPLDQPHCLQFLKVVCSPGDLPNSEMISLIGVGMNLLVQNKSENGGSFWHAAFPTYRANEIGSRVFAAYSKNLSTQPKSSFVRATHSGSGSTDRSIATIIDLDFSVKTETAFLDGLDPPQEGTLWDNLPANIEISYSGPDGVDLSSLSMSAFPTEEGELVNDGGTAIEIRDGFEGDYLNKSTSKVYWYGINPDNCCYFNRFSYTFKLTAPFLSEAITHSYPIMLPQEQVSYIPGLVDSSGDIVFMTESNEGISLEQNAQIASSSVIHDPIPSDDETFPYSCRITVGDFLKTGEYSPLFPGHGQFRSRTDIEERFHEKQWLGQVDSQSGGQGDCFTGRGISYALGFNSQTDIIVYGETPELAYSYAKCLLDSGELEEIDRSLQIFVSDRGYMELKAKDAAGYPAAWKYHCTYEGRYGKHPENHVHPAFGE